MSLPRVTILFANGNLLANVAAVDGIAGIVCSGTATASMPLKVPKQIFNLKDLAALGVSGEPVGITAATSGNLTVSSVGTDGDLFTVAAYNFLLGSYTKTASETTTAQIATALRASINSRTPIHGFTAGGTGSSIAVTAPLAIGSLINGEPISLAYPGGNASSTFTGGVSGIVNEHLYRQVKEYYDAIGGNQELWIMTVADTVTMAEMLDKDTPDHASLMLQQAGGRIRLLAVARKPHNGYNGGADYIDSDVPAAVTAAKALVEAQNDNLSFLRVLIEGRVQNPGSTTYYAPKDAGNGFAGVVLGGSLPNGSASIGLALGQACKYGAHIKLGKVANGALPMAEAYIGTSLITTMSNLAFLHGLGYISFTTHPGKAGIYFGIDRMASQDDYRLLAYGRVVDKAASIAAAVYTDVIESEIELQADGRIASQEVAYLRAIISQQLQALMGNQVSNFRVIIEEDQNIITTGKLNVSLQVQPLGYASFIEVTVGLSATV